MTVYSLPASSNSKLVSLNQAFVCDNVLYNFTTSGTKKEKVYMVIVYATNTATCVLKKTVEYIKKQFPNLGGIISSFKVNWIN